MAVKDLTRYQTQVGNTQDADTVFVKAGGQFQFVDTVLNGNQLKAWMTSQSQSTQIQNSAGVLSVTTAPLGVVVLSAAGAASNASIVLPSAIKGGYIKIDGTVLNAAASVIISNTAGDTIVGLGGSTIGTISLSATGILEVVCGTEGEWAVAARNASVDE